MTALLLLIGTYIVAGLAHTLSRSWAIGSHRAQAHNGKEGDHCDHWACDVMADDPLVVTLSFAIWPIMLPCYWVGRLANAVMKAPYLRSLPPKNSIDDDQGKPPPP